MSKKFGKNRSVDWRYYHVPLKYLIKFKGGANCDRADKYRDETYEEWKKSMIEHWGYIYDTPEKIEKELSKEAYEYCKKWEEENGFHDKKILVKDGRDKSLCIIDIYGKKKALVAFRNNKTCKIGMPRICPIIVKKDKWYIRYKDKDIIFSDSSGWVW